METLEYVAQLIEKSRVAQRIFEKYDQAQVDKIVCAIGKAVYDNGELLAKLAVDETGMGVYEDKIKKNKGKAKITWYRLKGKKSVGIIRYLPDEGIVEVAKPMGVIGAITPTTNPIITPMHNAMIALKGRNSLVICPHPRAKNCGKKAVDIMNEAIRCLDGPENLIQIVENPTVEISNLIMKMTDVCVSTGGPGMVKVAYSSGKPAFGVGAGNVQCIVDLDADLTSTVAKIIRGRTYDNGILCTCEQCAILPASRYDEYINAFVDAGAYYVHQAQEVESLRATTFPNGVLNKECVGASAIKLAAMARIEVPSDTKLLLVKTAGAGNADYLGKEKMFPVLAIYKYDQWQDAVAIVNENLEMDGKGHSVVIHSNTQANVEYAAERICVSRFLVNQIGSSGLGGSFDNGLPPTATLGCGSWGNNSISENLWYHHLINISRISYVIPDTIIPNDDEIWQ